MPDPQAPDDEAAADTRPPSSDETSKEIDLGELPNWIVVAALFLGLLTVLIVGTAVAITRSDTADTRATSAPEKPRATTPASPTPETPLANVPCDDSFIVEIRRSDPPFKNSAVEDALTGTPDAKYLEANNSCATYSGAGKRLIAYVGPYDTLEDACGAQLKTGDARAVPHRMNADQKGRSYCQCKGSSPTLSVNDGKNGDVGILQAIAEVQQMLKDLGYFTEPVAGDPFGPRTATAVQEFQLAVGLPATGIVDTTTWNALRRVTAGDARRFCR